MNRRRLEQLEQAAREAWLREQATRLDLSLEEAGRQSDLWEAQVRRYRVREGDLLSAEAIERFLREFSIAAAPEEDPERYVVETMMAWAEEEERDGRSRRG